jgi:hypothetical protein
MAEEATENKPDQVWWHIQSNDGNYLSRARFGTKESAIQEMMDVPKIYPIKTHHAVRVEYRFTETASAAEGKARPTKEEPADE